MNGLADPGPPRLALVAIVPEDETSRLSPGICDDDVVACGGMALLVARVDDDPDVTAAAVRHDERVRGAMDRCSAVLPFRLGTSVADRVEASWLLELNALRLAECLRRLSGRVEMGLKACLPEGPIGVSTPGVAATPLDVFHGLSAVRAIASLPADRRERVFRRKGRTILEGSYLIPRDGIDTFWAAVDGMRREMPQVVLVGSGPWAPYCFSDVSLVMG